MSDVSKFDAVGVIKYAEDATLMDRRPPGAVLHDPGTIANHVLEMVADNEIVTANGKRISARIDTICVHGDNAHVVGIARAVRDALASQEIKLAKTTGSS